MRCYIPKQACSCFAEKALSRKYFFYHLTIMAILFCSNKEYKLNIDVCVCNVTKVKFKLKEHYKHASKEALAVISLRYEKGFYKLPKNRGDNECHNQLFKMLCSYSLHHKNL